MESSLTDVIMNFSEDELLLFLASNIVSIISSASTIVYFALFILLIFYFIKNNKLYKRLDNIEYRFDNLEGYFKFKPDGTVTKVSDLDIDCETVDINKPTK